MTELETKIQRIADEIAAARRIAVVSGAGLSAESGVPTFRDAQTGLWARYDPMELATPEAFSRDPETVTRWYDWRRGLIAQCTPNPAHAALASLQSWAASGSAERPRPSVTLITQNVDGLLQRAGAHDVIELHGSIHTWKCTKTGELLDNPPLPFPEYPPRSKAGGRLRPCVVWFGETLPEAALTRAARDSAECDVFISVGTSAVVYPAAGLFHAAAAAGAFTIEINLERTSASDAVDIMIAGRAGEVLPQIVGRVTGG